MKRLLYLLLEQQLLFSRHLHQNNYIFAKEGKLQINGLYNYYIFPCNIVIIASTPKFIFRSGKPIP